MSVLPSAGNGKVTVPSILERKSAVSSPKSSATKITCLTAYDYPTARLLDEAGVDIFAKQLGSQFIFFQGHPEYDALSLQREYLRDITRFLAGERDNYPAFPTGYFDIETENKLASFRKRASVERRLPLSVELPSLTLRQDIAAGAAATAIFRNWLGYLSDGASAASPHADRGTPR